MAVKRLPSHPNPELAGLAMPQGVPGPNMVYRIMRLLCQVSMSMVWQVRIFGRHLEPKSGGCVYVCNHQSFLDPMLMSFALRRPMNYMARDSLFRMPGFAGFIRSLNAFPVRRGTADMAALKEAMRRLRSGRQVVVFAEGTRTRDGRIGRMLPGVAMLAQRAADWTVPVVIDGAFEAWPRTRALPGPGRVLVQYAEPIPREQARACRPEQLISSIRSRLIEMQTDLRRRFGRPALNYEQP